MCLATGGLERLLVEFSRLKDATRFQPQFVSLTSIGTPAEDIRANGCTAASVNLHRIGKRRALVALRRHFERERIDIVHTHNTYAHFYGALAARWAGVKHVINTQHGRGCGDSWRARMQFRLVNRFTDHIVGVSEDALRLCRRDDPRAADRMSCIWNGIDLDRFVFRGPADSMTAISVARLSPEKDFPTLLKAVAKVKPERPDFRLMLVGDGTERAMLEALATELDIHEAVQFLGERSDVHTLLGEAGFFVSSSRTEGISLTILEAMAVGLPVVTTAVGGSPEIVVENQTGRLVPSQDADALAAAILQMCDERERWPSMGAAGRQRVEEHFNIRTMVAAYETMYTALSDSSFRTRFSTAKR